MEKSTHTREISAVSRESSLLASIPSVHRLLSHHDVARLCGRYRREEVVGAVRSVLNELRKQVRSGHMVCMLSEQTLADRVSKALHRLHASRLSPVINGTGIVLHTNLGRAPLAREAAMAIQEIATGYSNLEYDLESGKRGSRYAHVEALLCRLTGAQAALVVNNCAAAVLLSLMALAEQGEVLVSRGELIEIGGSFRMPDVIAQSGARLVEVGATNKTTLRDYEQAINERTRMIVKSHPSNYRITGFTAQPDRRALSDLARRHQLVYVEDLGSGTLVDLRRYGLPHEPTIQECVRAGTQVIAFSGDKLLGGPQAGILVGHKDLIERMKQHPLLRALRVDKLVLAALEATLHLYDRPGPPENAIPVLGMLAARKDEIRQRARALQRRLRVLQGVTCTVEDEYSLAGGGALPATELPTSLLKVQATQLSADELAYRLRQQRPALIGRIVDDCFAIDLRTVTREEARLIPAMLQQAVA